MSLMNSNSKAGGKLVGKAEVHVYSTVSSSSVNLSHGGHKMLPPSVQFIDTLCFVQRDS